MSPNGEKLFPKAVGHGSCTTYFKEVSYHLACFSICALCPNWIIEFTTTKYFKLSTFKNTAFLQQLQRPRQQPPDRVDTQLPAPRGPRIGQPHLQQLSGRRAFPPPTLQELKSVQRRQRPLPRVSGRLPLHQVQRRLLLGMKSS